MYFVLYIWKRLHWGQMSAQMNPTHPELKDKMVTYEDEVLQAGFEVGGCGFSESQWDGISYHGHLSSGRLYDARDSFRDFGRDGHLVASQILLQVTFQIAHRYRNRHLSVQLETATNRWVNRLENCGMSASVHIQGFFISGKSDKMGFFSTPYWIIFRDSKRIMKLLFGNSIPIRQGNLSIYIR